MCKAKKSDHVHPILETLRWLPMIRRMQYKMSTICFNSISETVLIICPISLKLILQQDSCYPHPIHEPSCKQKKPLAKDHFPTLAHLSGSVCIKQSATLSLPPQLKPLSRRICSITISKLPYYSHAYPPPHPPPTSVCVCVSVCW